MCFHFSAEFDSFLAFSFLFLLSFAISFIFKWWFCRFFDFLLFSGFLDFLLFSVCQFETEFSDARVDLAPFINGNSIIFISLFSCLAELELEFVKFVFNILVAIKFTLEIFFEELKAFSDSISDFIYIIFSFLFFLNNSRLFFGLDFLCYLFFCFGLHSLFSRCLWLRFWLSLFFLFLLVLIIFNRNFFIFFFLLSRLLLNSIIDFIEEIGDNKVEFLPLLLCISVHFSLLPSVL